MTKYSSLLSPFNLCLSLLMLFFCLSSVKCYADSGASPNPPWYPSLEAFEHYNSGRSMYFLRLYLEDLMQEITSFIS